MNNRQNKTAPSYSQGMSGTGLYPFNLQTVLSKVPIILSIGKRYGRDMGGKYMS